MPAAIASLRPRRARGLVTFRAAAGAAVVLMLTAAGCGEVRRFPSGAFSVTVAPGETGNCALAPCEVFLEMPPGDGTYRVTGNQVNFGRYPAGRTVSLGNFYDPIAIEIVGAGVPRAFVYIPVYQ